MAASSPLAGLNKQQKTFVKERARGTTQAQAARLAGYSSQPYASKVENTPKIRDAISRLKAMQELHMAKTFVMSKEKTLLDLEYVKDKVQEAVDGDLKHIGSLNTYVRATELQGKELGMFAQKHEHEHAHSLIPNEDLLKRLQQSSPELADLLGKQLGVVIEGEFVEETKQLEDN